MGRLHANPDPDSNLNAYAYSPDINTCPSTSTLYGGSACGCAGNTDPSFASLRPPYNTDVFHIALSRDRGRTFLPGTVGKEGGSS